MTYDRRGAEALDYLNCRYGRSKLQFRGPRRRLKGDYITFVGGTETYGKCVQQPFVDLVQSALDMKCVNFGCMNAGIDAFINDPSVPQAANDARITVVQVMGAQNMSNRYYSVHPRRNDRFVRASKSLDVLYGNLDFSQFNFNGHLLQFLENKSPDRFQAIIQELRDAWVARMIQFLTDIQGPKILLWFANKSIEDAEVVSGNPLMIPKEMMDLVRPHANEIVEVCVSETAQALNSEGMIFDEMDVAFLDQLMGPAAHHEASEALVPALDSLL